MTVSEIHINLGILLQKVNTHRSKNFLPQELDMLFNLTLNTFKNKKKDLLSNPRQVSLFDTHTSLDNLSNLIETETLYPITINKEEAIVLLPFNFYGWINAYAKVAYDCPASLGTEVKNTTFTSQFIYNLKDIKLSELNTFLLAISYTNETNNTTKTSIVFDYTLLPEDYMGQDDVKDYIQSFVFIQALIKTIQLEFDKINEDRINKLYIKYDNKTEALVLYTTGLLLITLDTNSTDIEVIKKETIVMQESLLNTFNSPITISDTEYEPFINNSRLSGGTISELRGIRTSKQIKIKK